MVAVDLGNATRATLSNGVSMPLVGFGCAGKVPRGPLGEAFEAGFRLFDTAQAGEWYLEEELGAALNSSGVPRSSVFLTSKLHPRDLGERRTRDAVQLSLKRLGTDYLDAFLLHYPRCWGSLCGEGYEPEGTWRDSWRALEALYERGVLRAIGVSNFAPADLSELLGVARVRPHLVQSWMDPLHAERTLRALCLEHDVQFQAYSTLGTQHQTALNPVLKHPLLGQIARELGRSAGQVALRWALQNGAAVIPRSRRRARMEANLAVFDFSLSEAQMRDIDALDGTDPRLVRAPPPPPLACDDRDTRCGRWAEDGECDANPAFMHQTCAGSCGTCHKIEL